MHKSYTSILEIAILQFNRPIVFMCFQFMKVLASCEGVVAMH